MPRKKADATVVLGERKLAIRFPFPDKRLSPNKRIHHLHLTKVREEARQAGFLIARYASWKLSGKKPLELHMVICPPDRRKRDDDNIFSAFKSYRDGIFMALNLDDSLIHRSIIERGSVEKDGALYVSITEIKTPATKG